MGQKMLMKGNEAIAEAAIQAGCRFFFGYPITPQNQIPEYMSKRLPKIEGGCFLYDFLGIPVNADPNSPMIGVYRFKKGFNGEILGYVGEFDYVVSPFYTWLFNTANTAKHKFYNVLAWLRAKKNHTGASRKPAKPQNGSDSGSNEK